MPPVPSSSLPFLTRTMLAFEQTVTFSLRIDMQSDTAAALAIRGMTREGMFTYSTTTAADSLITQATFALPDIPIYITIEDSARVLVQGSTFITISLMANGNVIQQLTSGYIYAQKALSWPNTSQVDLRSGGGKLTATTTADPPAGSIAEITVPAGEVWKIKSANIALVTDATVASRYPYIEFSPAAGGLIEGITGGNQTASLAYTWIFAIYGSDPLGAANNIQLVPIPTDISLAAGSTIIFKAGNMQAGDNFGAGTVQYEKFFTTP